MTRQSSIHAISTLTPLPSRVTGDEIRPPARVGRTQLLRLSAPASDRGQLKTGFRSAVRSQTSLLAPIEQVCLKWLARHMPAETDNPNRLPDVLIELRG